MKKEKKNNMKTVKNNNDLFICEISEADFRKLNIFGYKHDRDGRWIEVSLNEELDENIKYWLEQGYETDYEDLTMPVTVAIHKENGPNPNDFYLDKYLNRSGATTYYLAMGIYHLYSTRDYFEDKGEYWRVPKRQTSAIYRIHLDKKWLKKFKLKHKSDSFPWTGAVPEGCKDAKLQINYDLDEKTGEWNERSRCKVFNFGHSIHVIPIKDEENELVSENKKIN